MNPPRYLTLLETAHYFSEKPSAIVRWTEVLGLPCFEEGGELRFLVSELEEWVAAQQGQPRGENKPGPCDLYRCFDSSGALLYVGISWSAACRLATHNQGAEWWSQVRTITVEHYPDRAAAREVELRAIKSENPIHNKADKPK